MRIRAGVILTALVPAAAGSAATAKSPSVSLASPRSGAVAGRPWTAVLVIRGAQPAGVALVAASGSRRVVASARRWRGNRYRARLSFPTAGRWALSARVGEKRFRLGAVVVRAAVRPPLAARLGVLHGGDSRAERLAGGLRRIDASGRISTVRRR